MRERCQAVSTEAVAPEKSYKDSSPFGSNCIPFEMDGSEINQRGSVQRELLREQNRSLQML